MLICSDVPINTVKVYFMLNSTTSYLSSFRCTAALYNNCPLRSTVYAIPDTRYLLPDTHSFQIITANCTLATMSVAADSVQLWRGSDSYGAEILRCALFAIVCADICYWVLSGSNTTQMGHYFAVHSAIYSSQWSTEFLEPMVINCFEPEQRGKRL